MLPENLLLRIDLLTLFCYYLIWREEPEKVEETDEDLIENAEKDFYKVIEAEKKVRETKHAESNKALQDAKNALENDRLPVGDEVSEDNVRHDAIIEESEVCIIIFQSVAK